jgi:hypothetical protein
LQNVQILVFLIVLNLNISDLNSFNKLIELDITKNYNIDNYGIYSCRNLQKINVDGCEKINDLNFKLIGIEKWIVFLINYFEI